MTLHRKCKNLITSWRVHTLTLGGSAKDGFKVGQAQDEYAKAVRKCADDLEKLLGEDAPECKATGCTRKTRAESGYCFQHYDFPKYGGNK